MWVQQKLGSAWSRRKLCSVITTGVSHLELRRVAFYTPVLVIHWLRAGREASQASVGEGGSRFEGYNHSTRGLDEPVPQRGLGKVTDSVRATVFSMASRNQILHPYLGRSPAQLPTPKQALQTHRSAQQNTSRSSPEFRRLQFQIAPLFP